VKNNDNLPEPEVFTSKIEETIDDLFKPAKQIEIDPLTQEVKEVATEQQKVESKSEISLELAIEEPLTEEGKEVQQEPEIEVTGSKSTAVNKDEIVQPEQERQALEADREEEPQIELELVEEEPAILEVEADENKQSDEVLLTLQRLREDIYTIEWEISRKELLDSVSELQKIIELPEIKSDSIALTILSLSAEVLKNASKAPNEMKSNAPSILKRAIEAVITLRSGASLANDEIETVKQHLHSLLIPKARKSPKAPIPPQTEPEAHQKFENTWPELESTISTDTSKEPEWNEEANKLLLSHLKELQKQVNRIIPLEQLLLKTSGMEKLYKFQKNVRQDLEKEIERLSRFFFKDLDINLPKPERTYKHEDYESEIASNRCPWSQLFTLSINGLEIGIPVEEVVYNAQPPWLSKSFIKKTNILPLSKLKPWPWSKLSKLFKNRLAKVTESELTKMKFPVVKRLGNTELTVAANFYVIVLFNGNKGAVLRTQESPIMINVPQNAKCQQATDGSFAGEIEINGNKISIVTAESVNR